MKNNNLLILRVLFELRNLYGQPTNGYLQIGFGNSKILRGEIIPPPMCDDGINVSHNNTLTLNQD
jgi:hypothetical protein